MTKLASALITIFLLSFALFIFIAFGENGSDEFYWIFFAFLALLALFILKQIINAAIWLIKFVISIWRTRSIVFYWDTASNP